MPPDASPETHLAAGPWCFLGKEQDCPDWPDRYAFASEPLASEDKVRPAARAAQCLCVKIIRRTAILINGSCAPSDEYWEILLAPWAINLASILVERSLRCRAMLEEWGDLELLVPVLPEECDFAFRNESDVVLRGSLNVEFNHWLFSRLLEYNWPANWQKIKLNKVSVHSGAPKRKWRKLLRGMTSSLAFPPIKGMNLQQALKLSMALRHPCHSSDRTLDFAREFDFQPDLDAIPLPNNIDIFIHAALPASIRMLKHPEITRRSSRPRLRVADISWQEDAKYRQKLAIWRAQGNRIAHSQHGGNYGVVRIPCSAEITEYSQDIFFSWGWKHQGSAKGNFVPLPSLLLSSERDSWTSGRHLIFVGAEMAAYSYRLDSRPTPMQFLQYRKAKAHFFRAVGASICEQALYRPYFPVPGTFEDAEWLLPQFPSLKKCTGPLWPQIQHCKLVVLDHHGTTLLEAMAGDIPMICYWNPSFWPVTETFKHTLDLLADAGIWHSEAEEAASKVREIWDDVTGWWTSESVQKARSGFCEKFALSSADAIKIWQNKLIEI